MREDGREEDVFALIGPKRYDVPWKVLENRGYIAEALCTEYRIPLPREEELEYAHADQRQKFRVASENSRKIALAEELIINHPDDSILVIGQYISQLEKLAEELNLPLITGKTNYVFFQAAFESPLQLREEMLSCALAPCAAPRRQHEESQTRPPCDNHHRGVRGRRPVLP